MLITGVVVGSAAYNLMQNKEIRFLDVIEKLNNQSVSGLRQSFAQTVEELPSIRLLIKRPISLPPTSNIISESQLEILLVVALISFYADVILCLTHTK